MVRTNIAIENMKILVVTYNPHREKSVATVVGAFSSMDAVRKAFPSIQFSTEGENDERLIVTEIELDADPY